MTHTGSILLAVEDPTSRTFLTDNLRADGYHVLAVDSRAAALSALQASRPQLVIADVNGETLTLIDAVRGADGIASRIAPETPLIVLTARKDELARIRYLERGSDDVLSKPYAYSELRARVRALLRRAGGPPAGRVIRVGEIAIDTLARTVHVAGTPVALATKEYALLVKLAGEPTKVFTKGELLREIWGCRTVGVSRTLDSHACKLRTKLRGASSSGERWVENVWGVGYRLAPVGAREPEPIAGFGAGPRRRRGARRAPPA